MDFTVDCGSFQTSVHWQGTNVVLPHYHDYNGRISKPYPDASCSILPLNTSVMLFGMITHSSRLDVGSVP